MKSGPVNGPGECVSFVPGYTVIMANLPYPQPQVVQTARPGVAWDSKAVSVVGGDVTFTGAWPDAIRVDGAGTVAFVTAGGTTESWTCVAGDMIPVVVAKILQAGTSATGLHALYASATAHS